MRDTRISGDQDEGHQYVRTSVRSVQIYLDERNNKSSI